MVHGQRLTTFLIIVVLLNTRQIESGKIRRIPDSDENGDLIAGASIQHRKETKLKGVVTAAFEHAQHHHLHERQIQENPVIHHAEEPGQENEERGLENHQGNTESGSDFEKDGEIHVEALHRRVREDGEEREDFSGNGDGRRVEIRDIHYHIHKSKNARRTLDDEDSEPTFSEEDNHKEKLDEHEGNKDSDGEFGYVTDEEEAELPEDNDDGAFSGEQTYDHEHLKTLHVHRRAQHVKKSRDSHVPQERIQQEVIEGGADEDDEYSGEAHVHRQHVMVPRDFHVEEKGVEKEVAGEDNEDEYSGEEERDSAHERRDVHLPLKRNVGDNKSKKQGKANESGEEGPSRGEGEKIPEDNNEDEDLQKENKKRLKEALHVHKALKQQKVRDVDSQTGTQKDFYIDESDAPKEKLHEVEMQDFEDGQEIADREKRQIDKRTEKTETVKRFRRGPSRHLLQFDNTIIPTAGYIPVFSTQCFYPTLIDKIAEDVVIYIRSECRLCQCKMGELVCALKPQFCDEARTNRSCHMETGELANGERHFDGCNHCLCRNGDLLCTRVRCPSANYNYTHYRISSDDILENATKASASEGHVRGKDPCMDCDYDPILPVCGPNWKTYRSMCHALQCGGLKVEDVKQGTCDIMNACDEAKCAEHEICLVRKEGPCLASTTTDGNIVECPQCQCVNPTKDCSLDVEREVCGEDDKTHASECTMFARGVAFAYNGPCKKECIDADTRMCGVDGMTFVSSCHAARLNSHVDYPGGCDDVDTQDNVLMNNGYYNRRCETVEELLRCPEIDCTKLVIPEGSCCRACGIAISIRLDTSARDMTTLKLAEDQPHYKLNRLGLIHTTLKALSNSFGNNNKCQLTTDLVDTNDISVVYKPIKSEDVDVCEQVARATVDYINSPAKNDLEPGWAVLAVAVVVEQSEMTFGPRAEPVTSVMAKRRRKRADHHEHEPFENQSERIGPQNIFLLFLVVLGLYWSTSLAEY